MDIIPLTKEWDLEQLILKNKLKAIMNFHEADKERRIITMVLVGEYKTVGRKIRLKMGEDTWII